MHPYEMKIQMRDRGQDRLVGSKNASIYDTVERLAKYGYIEAVETSREGRRPERTVYQITEKGVDEVRVWMRDLISQPSTELPALSAGLMFIAALHDKAEVVALLQRRAVLLEADIAATEIALKAAAEEQQLPRIFLVEDEFANHIKRCEAKWVRQFAKELSDGTIPWPVFPTDGGTPHM